MSLNISGITGDIDNQIEGIEKQITDLQADLELLKQIKQNVSSLSPSINVNVNLNGGSTSTPVVYTPNI